MGLFSSIGKAVGGALGSIAGAVGGVASSIIGSKSQSSANDANMGLAREQLAYQKELAQNQIQWKVEDAKKAGLHPLAGLGVSPASYSPVSGGAVGYDYSGLGNSLQQMGQDIDRSIMQGKDREERRKALELQDKSIALDLQAKDLNNQILQSELASRRIRLAQQMGPPTPSTRGLSAGKYAIPGQVDGRFMDKPVPQLGWAYDDKGRRKLVPGQDYQQLYEDKLFLEWWPFIQTWMREADSRITGDPVAGRVYDSHSGDWVRAPVSRNRKSVKKERYKPDIFDSYRNVWR
uniref:DNA pilot protein n=1 Tax=Dulem virus 91 TaxID=3145802 RepID=A0AAU8B1A6_9VIRU